MGPKIRNFDEVVKVRVGEDKIAKRVKQLACCLVGRWGGGTSSLSEVKSLKRRAWSAWKVKGRLNVVELERGLWLFEFETSRETKRILGNGTRRLGASPFSLKSGDKKKVVE